VSVFVDTSAFFALMDADDANHEMAKNTWQLLLDHRRRLICSNYIAVETVALLQHRLGLESVRSFVHDILPVVQVEWVTEADHAAALSLLFTTGRRRVSFVDCTSFVIANREGIREAFCYDPHFEQFGFQIVRLTR